MKIFAVFSIFLLLFFPVMEESKVESITDSFDCAVKMQITVENVTTELSSNNDNFKSVLEALKDITEYAHDMPAFGVSLDDLTKEEIKTGVWLELQFDKTYIFNEMPFDSLLIKVEKDSYGFNLIRGNKGKYEGRCFYLSLDESMNKLYNKINSL